MFRKIRTWILAAVASISLFFGWQYLSAAAGLAWVAPTTNTDGSPLTDLDSYRVYRRPSATTGAYVQIAQVAAPATTYTDNSTVEGVNCYVVTAVDTAGNVSDFSNQACKTIDTLRPNAPSGLTVN